MEREIKFRAWQKKYSAMWYDGGHMDLSLSIDGQLFTPDRYYSCDFEKEFALMQYTGLKDKNGKEIYEGDIVPTPWGKSVITWSNDFAGFFAKRGGTHIALTEFQAEVIGNIYENPKLVEVEA